MPVNAFTITSNNYLGMARVLADSYLAHHPGATVYACLVDRPSDAINYGDLPFEVILAENLGIERFPGFSFKYDILELNTAVKPFVFKFLRDQIGIDRALYFDPDIWIHDRLIQLEEALDQNQAVLTPHLTQPLDNSCRPPERVIGMCGIYNLGFVGLRLDDGTKSFLDWWCDRLDRYCFVDLANGMFVDQSWMDFAPAYLNSVAIVRDPIFNIAYWNLPHRHPVKEGGVWKVEGRRVGFVHFSGVDVRDASLISRHQDRLDLGLRPELRPLFDGYSDLVMQSGQNSFKAIPYFFGNFSNTEIPIPAVARRAFHEVDPCGLRWPDPFDVRGDDPFLGWLVAPLDLDGVIVNRAALYLWQDDDSLKREFPRIDGDDLERYAKWFVKDGAEQYALHSVFVDALSGIQESHGFFDWKRLRRVRLADPGTEASWLNEIVGEGTSPGSTRLASAIHTARPDLQERYPDPQGADRLGLGYWIARFGAEEYGLHPELIRPILRSLPARSSLSLQLRRGFGLRKPGGAETRKLQGPASTEGMIPHIHLGDETTMKVGGQLGVNVVGLFSGAGGGGSFASAIRDGLTGLGIPNVAVAVDHDLPDLMTTARIRFESGAPYPVTILALPPAQWDSTIRKLPAGCRAGGGLVGYCCEQVEALRAADMTGVDEVWVPTHREAHRIVQISPVPVRPVAPPVPEGMVIGSTPRFDLDPDLSWLLAVDFGRGEADDRAISRAIECFRRMSRGKTARVGLLVLVRSGRAHIASEVCHLPISVFSGDLTAEVIHEALTRCDAYLDLSRQPIFAPVNLLATLYGIPTVGGSQWDLAEYSGADSKQEPALSEAGSPPTDILGSAIDSINEIFDDEDCDPGSRRTAPDDGARIAWQAEAIAQWRRELGRVIHDAG